MLAKSRLGGTHSCAHTKCCRQLVAGSPVQLTQPQPHAAPAPLNRRASFTHPSSSGLSPLTSEQGPAVACAAPGACGQHAARHAQRNQLPGRGATQACAACAYAYYPPTPAGSSCLSMCTMASLRTLTQQPRLNSHPAAPVIRLSSLQAVPISPGAVWQQVCTQLHRQHHPIGCAAGMAAVAAAAAATADAAVPARAASPLAPPSPADWLCTPFPGTRPAATGTQLYEPNTGDKLSGWTVQGAQVSQWALGGYSFECARLGNALFELLLPCHSTHFRRQQGCVDPHHRRCPPLITHSLPPPADCTLQPFELGPPGSR